MQQIAEAVVNRYLGTNPQKIASLGGGWYGRAFLAGLAKELERQMQNFGLP